MSSLFIKKLDITNNAYDLICFIRATTKVHFPNRALISAWIR